MSSNLSLSQIYVIKKLTDEMPVLRAKLDLTQEELARRIGVTRQTVNAIEGKKRDMPWSMFMSLVLLFYCNSKTAQMLEHIGIRKEEINKMMDLPHPEKKQYQS